MTTGVVPRDGQHSTEGQAERSAPPSARPARGSGAHGLGKGATQANTGMIGIALGSALLYGVLATAMTFVNKAVLIHFPLATSALVLQFAITVLLLYGLAAVRALRLPSLSLAKARQLAPVSLLYTAYTVVALCSLHTLNVPMYSVIKRLTPIIVLITKSVWKRVLPRKSICASVVIIMIGTIIAGYNDLTFDAQGYALATGSCVLQAVYLLLVEFSGAEQGVSTVELMLYNALLSLPLLSCIAWWVGEFDLLQGAVLDGVRSVGGEAYFAVFMFMFASLGAALNYSLFLCTMHNSALTTTIVGALKSCASVVLGFFLLGGVPWSTPNAAGIAINTAGGVWYSMIKYHEKSGMKHGEPLKPVAQSASQPLLLGRFVKDDVESGAARPGSRLAEKTSSQIM